MGCCCTVAGIRSGAIVIVDTGCEWCDLIETRDGIDFAVLYSVLLLQLNCMGIVDGVVLVKSNLNVCIGVVAAFAVVHADVVLFCGKMCWCCCCCC